MPPRLATLALDHEGWAHCQRQGLLGHLGCSQTRLESEAGPCLALAGPQGHGLDLPGLERLDSERGTEGATGHTFTSASAAPVQGGSCSTNQGNFRRQASRGPANVASALTPALLFQPQALQRRTVGAESVQAGLQSAQGIPWGQQ